MTNLTRPTVTDLLKWKAEAAAAAAKLKQGPLNTLPDASHITVGFAFDDPTTASGVRIVKFDIQLSRIASSTVEELATYIHDTVLQAVTWAIDRGVGESAVWDQPGGRSATHH
jgi:hypothetical protein